MNFIKLTLAKVNGVWMHSTMLQPDDETRDVMWTTSPGVEAIARERGRQQDSEGFDAVRDAQYVKAELSNAARSYATRAVYLIHLLNSPSSLKASNRPPALWPWTHDWWKPSEDPIRNLEKAGALIAAEIDRLTAERESGVVPAEEAAAA